MLSYFVSCRQVPRFNKIYFWFDFVSLQFISSCFKYSIQCWNFYFILCSIILTNSRFGFSYISRDLKRKLLGLVIPNGYFSPWTVYSFFWGMDPSFNYQKWQRPKLRACRQHFFCLLRGSLIKKKTKNRA